jgi:hypothetical protein
MPIEAFAALFGQWADWYDNERPHDGLDGRPLQAWEDDPGPLHRISPDRLRHLLLASGERIIGKDGIRFSSLAYIAPELHGRGGQRVQIGYMPGVLRHAAAERRRPERVRHPRPRRAPSRRPARHLARGGRPCTYGQVLEADERSWRELTAAEPIRIPDCARALFAAHLAYRRASGAASSDPYFVHPRDPANKPATEILRAAIRSTAERLGLDLPWMHGDDCRYGADIGLTWRGQSWLAERGLRLARTGPGQDLAIMLPRPIACARPRWLSGGPP